MPPEFGVKLFDCWLLDDVKFAVLVASDAILFKLDVELLRDPPPGPVLDKNLIKLNLKMESKVIEPVLPAKKMRKRK